MGTTSGRQFFSDPNKDAAIMAAWERFLEGGSHSSNVLRVLIDESWRRCRKQRVDPGQRSAPPPVEQTVLDGLKSCQGDLLKASGPIMACAVTSSPRPAR